MDHNHNLEQLLESLIKMVGKGNQKIDSLQRRVCQLECIIKEQEVWERGPLVSYTDSKASETH